VLLPDGCERAVVGLPQEEAVAASCSAPDEDAFREHEMLDRVLLGLRAVELVRLV
jgi:hypothetical protein